MITFENWVTGGSETKSQMCNPFSKLPVSYSSVGAGASDITVHASFRGDGVLIREQTKCSLDEMYNAMTEINTSIVRQLKK